jgi:alpha-L-fucosidase 2
MPGIDPIQRLAQYDVCWTTPSDNASGSMPLGNGDFALNAWVEPDGDLLLLLAKADAWDENSINLKLGRLRLRLDPPLPTSDASGFSQRLRLATAMIDLHVGDVHLRLWVDANRPVLHIDITSEQPRAATVTVELWRNAPRQIKTQTSDMFKNLAGKNADPHPTIVTPDHVVATGHADRLAWCHCNERRSPDPYEVNLRLQGLGAAMASMPHPLLGRTFGAVVEARHASATGARQLTSPPATHHRFTVHAVSLHPGTERSWTELANERVDLHRAADADADWDAHLRWWTAFWQRSWIFVTATDAAERDAAFRVTRAYVLQRFMNGAAGRGPFPIKHNGSLFSVGNPEDPDFRRWGGPGFWFQNQRLIYWPMLAAGDFDLLRGWLEFYAAMLPLQRLRTTTYFQHAGAHFPETVTFWGAEVSSHYCWTPFEDRSSPEAESPYLRYYWSGGIELVLMMCEYVRYTADTEFAQRALLPTAEAVLSFYQHHYPRDAEGRLRFAPAQSLETWHEAVNPTPEIAGLRYTIRAVLDLPDGLVPAALRRQWSTLLAQVGDIPLGEKDGTPVILPAETYDRKKNVENPELYCVFPYRIFGQGKPGLQLARDTFAHRLNHVSECWSQDEIQAALLGLTADAKRGLVQRAAPAAHSDSRFPGFWNAFHDWVPDVDHGGVLQLALQLMLLQDDAASGPRLGAWPREWDADFKLHAPGPTTVEGSVRNGVLFSHHIGGSR